MLVTYTYKDRIRHLTKLSEELDDLCVHLKNTGLFPEMLEIYMSRKHDVKTLLLTPFSQSELSELSRAIPDLYSRHKEWIPPLEETDDGIKEPDWFQALEMRLQPVLKSVQLLREIGYY